MESDVFFLDFHLFQLAEAALLERPDQFLNQILRRGSSRGDRDRPHPVQPLRPDLAQIIDQIGGYAGFLANLHQPPRIGAVLGADHQQHLAQRNHRLYRKLAVLGGLRNIKKKKSLDLRKSLPEPVDDVFGFIQTERRLRDKRNTRGIADLQAIDVLHGRYQYGRLRRLAQRADDLVVVLMPDQNDRVALFGEFDRLQMNLGDQRAGGVDHLQPPLLGLSAHRRRHAVGAENHPRAFGNLVQLLDKNGSGAA